MPALWALPGLVTKAAKPRIVADLSPALVGGTIMRRERILRTQGLRDNKPARSSGILNRDIQGYRHFPR